MPKVRIRDEAYQAIRARATNEFKDEGVQQPSGYWIVPFEQDTIDRVEQQMLKGETFSDTLIRICNTAGRKLS